VDATRREWAAKTRHSIPLANGRFRVISKAASRLLHSDNAAHAERCSSVPLTSVGRPVFFPRAAYATSPAARFEE
jgi:hypothetical protein